MSGGKTKGMKGQPMTAYSTGALKQGLSKGSDVKKAAPKGKGSPMGKKK